MNLANRMKLIEFTALLLVVAGGSAAACGSSDNHGLARGAGGAGGEGGSDPLRHGGATSSSRAGGSRSGDDNGTAAGAPGAGNGSAGESGAAGAAAAEGGAAGAGGRGGDAGAAGCDVDSSGWNVSRDFRIAPDNENPSRDRHGNVGVWHYLERPAGQTHSSSQDSSLSTFLVVADTNRWQSPLRDAFHLVGRGTATCDPLFMHPFIEAHAVVGWRSPATTTVSVTGAFRDADATCGNGIAWFVDLESETLAQGSFANGGEATLDAEELTGIEVTEGDMLYFIVSAEGEHSCDSTTADIIISGSRSAQPQP